MLICHRLAQERDLSTQRTRGSPVLTTEMPGPLWHAHYNRVFSRVCSSASQGGDDMIPGNSTEPRATSGEPFHWVSVTATYYVQSTPGLACYRIICITRHQHNKSSAALDTVLTAGTQHCRKSVIF